MKKRADKWMAGLGVAIFVACLTVFMVVGAMLAWRVEPIGPLAMPATSIAKLTVAAADLGWRSWAR